MWNTNCKKWQEIRIARNDFVNKEGSQYDLSKTDGLQSFFQEEQKKIQEKDAKARMKNAKKIGDKLDFTEKTVNIIYSGSNTMPNKEQTFSFKIQQVVLNDQGRNLLQL